MTHTKHLVFVYGTLKGMHRFRSSKFLSVARTSDKYVLYNGGFPSCVNENSINEEYKGYVLGELHEVDDELLENLDAYEGHPSHFERKQITVIEDDGVNVNETEAWMYFGPDNSYVHRDPIKPSNDIVSWPTEKTKVSV